MASTQVLVILSLALSATGLKMNVQEEPSKEIDYKKMSVQKLQDKIQKVKGTEWEKELPQMQAALHYLKENKVLNAELPEATAAAKSSCLGKVQNDCFGTECKWFAEKNVCWSATSPEQAADLTKEKSMSPCFAKKSQEECSLMSECTWYAGKNTCWSASAAQKDAGLTKEKDSVQHNSCYGKDEPACGSADGCAWVAAKTLCWTASR